jgi:lactate racemase
MQQYRNPRELIQGFLARPFRMGAHKAYLWARSLDKAEVYMVSAMAAAMRREFMTLPAESIEQVLEGLRPRYPRPPKIAVMPKANSTYARILRSGDLP